MRSAFGSNQAMLQSDAQQAAAVLTEDLSAQQQIQDKQKQLMNIALSLLAAAILVKMISPKEGHKQ